MEKKPETILIFTNDIPIDVTKSETKRGGINSLITGSSQKIAEVKVEEMQKKMSQFIKNLDKIMASSPKEVGGLTLDEIEIHANIDSKGNIGIAGIFGAELAMQGGIKFILRKKINQ
jgi:hypothetical protein